MITVKLAGGLGNQMFQYAIGRHLAIKYNTELSLDLSFLLNRSYGHKFVYRDYYLDIFNIVVDEIVDQFPWYKNIKNKIAERCRINLPGIRVESHFHSDARNLDCGPNCYLAGYWQSPRYFSEIAETIRKDFTFTKSVRSSSLDLFAHIKKTNAVCLNVRRSDYIGNKLHDVCGLKYYQDALDLLTTRLGECTVFVFSDDINWCEENLKISGDHLFVGHEHAHTTGFKNFDAYLYMMSHCKHYIIPNSTFAWWAVWLNNDSEKIVIAPSRWFNDDRINAEELYDQAWIRL
jgi:Glycosyl transferase family 11